MTWKCPVKGCDHANEKSENLTKHIFSRIDEPHKNWIKKNVSLGVGNKTLKEVTKELEGKFEKN